jgi:hypothetical protein
LNLRGVGKSAGAPFHFKELTMSKWLVWGFVFTGMISVAEGVEVNHRRFDVMVEKSEIKDLRKKLAEVQDARYLCQQAMEQCCQ